MYAILKRTWPQCSQRYTVLVLMTVKRFKPLTRYCIEMHVVTGGFGSYKCYLISDIHSPKKKNIAKVLHKNVLTHCYESAELHGSILKLFLDGLSINRFRHSLTFFLVKKLLHVSVALMSVCFSYQAAAGLPTCLTCSFQMQHLTPSHRLQGYFNLLLIYLTITAPVNHS